MKRTVITLFSLVVLMTLTGAAFAQGVQTATLTGTVKSSEGQGLPGVSITVRSPSLQGERTVFSGAEGDYIVRGLPPGEYTIRFELDGMTTVERRATLELGRTSRADADMRVSDVEETIVVTGEAPTALETTQLSHNMGWDTVDELPVNRDFDNVGDLAPGVTTNTPNNDQLTISGGFAYDNVFLIDGVDVNDNIFGVFHDLFIEDAVEEQQVLTSGISAEYGRFSGGVINIITKSGGNQFSGSLRLDRTNPDWRERTPLEIENGVVRQDEDNDVWSATLGGPIVKDHLWFFLAGRQVETATNTALVLTNVPVNLTSEEDRYEYKLTATLGTSHTFQGTYTEVERSNFRRTFSFSATPSTTFNNTEPSELRVARYNGVLTSNLFAEAQWSEKEFGFPDSGGTSTDIRDSPFLDFTEFVHYNAPWFSANDPEERNNEQVAGSLSFFLTGATAGSHDLKVGAEQFTSTLVGGNDQSSTGFSFFAGFKTDANGDPVLINNELVPLWEPGVTTVADWRAQIGATQDIETLSFYVNDKWDLNDHWSFNVGFRYEDVTSDATGGLVGIDTSSFVPRLAASYDVKGDGKWKVDTTYSQYAGKYQDGQIAGNTNVGNPDTIYLYYVGPAGEGVGFAPGFDLGNYVPYAASFPTANVIFDRDLKSPTSDEFTLSLGYQLPRGGYLKGSYINREVSDFIEDFINLGTGQTILPGDLGPIVGPLDNTFFSNSNAPVREYEALQFQGRYRITRNWSVEGNYTLQLTNDGNFEGEATNQPGQSSALGDYPEITPKDRFFPEGRLNDFQEHKVRLWTNYNLNLGRAGTMAIGLLYSYDSGLAYSLNQQRLTTPQQNAILAQLGYANAPGRRDLFFGPRGSETFGGSHIFDLALNYSVPIWKTLEPWVKVELRNVLNKVYKVQWSTAISADVNSADPNDPLGLPTTFTPSSTFGAATNSANHFATPRELRVSVGLRF